MNYGREEPDRRNDGNREAEFDAFRQAKAKNVAEEKARADREMYKQHGGRGDRNALFRVAGYQREHKESKRTVMVEFQTILEMKSDLSRRKQRSISAVTTHSINSEGSNVSRWRVLTDGYRIGGGGNCHREGSLRMPARTKKPRRW